MQKAETQQSAHMHLWGRWQLHRLQRRCAASMKTAKALCSQHEDCRRSVQPAHRLQKPAPRRSVLTQVTASPAGKLAGLDKKLSNNLEDTVKESSSPVELSKSPVGPLADPTRWVPLAVEGSASIALPVAFQGLEGFASPQLGFVIQH